MHPQNTIEYLGHHKKSILAILRGQHWPVVVCSAKFNLDNGDPADLLVMGSHWVASWSNWYFISYANCLHGDNQCPAWEPRIWRREPEALLMRIKSSVSSCVKQAGQAAHNTLASCRSWSARPKEWEQAAPGVAKCSLSTPSLSLTGA